MGYGVSDGHHDSGRRAVAADIGNEDAPFAFGQREEVIIVTAGPLGRLVMRRQIQTGNCRESGR